eukprot:CAMPEP_0172474848 /NCGR_PEP_ID=MMETSP1065-20121228/69569_1 /TAXON_ID=265537 /ORGANISM="Amphiprora paludosa, Strain CCMP125" /LENGTH=500 /DNA_ID=CAMNT_0013233039 /DNA_START=111 /DNA_END=1613 /DNA_ORIENTATION=+
MPKVYYFQRASGFDRLLILLMGVTCVFLVNLVARGTVSPGNSLSSIKDFNESGVRGASIREDVVNKIKTLQVIKDSQNHQNEEATHIASDARGAFVPGEALVKAAEPLPSIFSKRAAAPSEGGELVRAEFPLPQSKEYGLWKNKYNVVHVMHSRFMQLQPDLLELGKARIELFKTFTLRSFREQSTKEFLWIIFTDPELDESILNELKGLIKYDKNILLVGMNHGFHDFRSDAWMTGIETVFSGEIQMLKDYHVAAQNHVYLETRIDMDDSMYQDFMRQLQGGVGKTLVKTARRHQYDSSKYPETEFRVFCPEHHLEWGYFNPWDKESKKGHLYGIHSPEFCITAGLSHAYQVGTKPLEITGHHRLSKSYPQCRDLKPGNVTNCLDRVPDAGYKYVVIRSRTPTSAGMAHVIPASDVVKSEEWKQKQKETWDNYIFRNFGTTPRSIWALRQTLSDNMEAILKDAIKGHCTRADFTCKESSKSALTKILNQVKEHDSSKSR